MKKLLLLLMLSLSSLEAMIKCTIYNNSGYTLKVGNRTVIRPDEWKPFQCTPNTEIIIQKDSVDDSDDNSLASEKVTIDQATTLLSIGSHMRGGNADSKHVIHSMQQVSRPLIIQNSSRLDLLLTICRRFFGMHGEEINLAPYSRRALNIPWDVHSVGIWKIQDGEVAADTPDLSVILVDDAMGLDIKTESTQGSLFTDTTTLQVTQLHLTEMNFPEE